MGITLRFSEEDWERIERDWSAWWAGDLNRPMVMMERSPRYPLPGKVSGEFLRESPVESMLDHYQEALEDRHFYGDAFPKMYAFFGPGIVAGFLGADVHCTPETRTVWFDVPEVAEIGELRFRYDPENFWWRRAFDLTRAAVDRFGSQVAVAHTDLGGAVDILASFRTTEGLLYELSDSPDQVTRLLEEITLLWLRYYAELLAVIQGTGRGTTPWAPIWSPERCYMFQCDFCYMISPQMFERFVLPDLSTCFSRMDHAFYHLDGKGQIRHLDMLLALDELAGIQWIPGGGQPQADEWPSLLKRIRDAGKLCQVYVSAEGALRIVRELGGRGFALYVVNQMPPDEARDFLELLASEDISR